MVQSLNISCVLTMFLKQAWRSIFRNKTYAFINIGGLGLGITAFLFILQYIGMEKSVNRLHTNLPNMVRLVNENSKGEMWVQVEPGWAERAKQRFPEINGFCRFEDGIAQGIVQNPESNISFREQKIGYAEGNFFEFFSFPLLSGDPGSLRRPETVFLSSSAVEKYFGKEEALGKRLSLSNQFGNKLFSVGGVYADMEENSDIRYDMVFSLEALKSQEYLGGNDWASLDNLDNQYINMFFSLNENTDLKALEKKLTVLRNELSQENDGVTFRLQPLADVHLASKADDNYPHTGQRKYVNILSAIAILILLIAWFNYINFSTAKSLQRANEVGVRKVIGASRANLVMQYLSESILMNLLAVGLAFALVQFLQPLFNVLIDKDLSLVNILNPGIWIWGLVLLTAGMLFSGTYTAFVLSDFKPVDTLKGKWVKGGKGALLRQALVVAQFSVSLILIITTLVIFNQLKYMQTEDLGFDKDQLVVIQGPQIGTRDSSFNSMRSGFWNEIKNTSFIREYCVSGSIPGKWYNFMTSGFTQPRSRPGDELISYSFAIIGDRYLTTYGIPLLAGRNFTEQECDVEWSNNSKVILNEKAIKQLGFNSPEEALTTRIKWDERYLDIIGVIKDYHHTGLQRPIDPMIFYPQDPNGYFTLRLTADQMSTKLASLEKTFKTYFNGNPFEYFFVDENFNQAYRTEKQYGQLFSVASGWAIFIACLGLFGLATYTIQARTREIGIRKVLGASVQSIVGVLSKEFLILIGIAILLATPIAYFAANRWLKDFAYRIDIQWWVFVLAAGIVMSLTLVTIGFRAFKAAVRNPVSSLRAE